MGNGSRASSTQPPALILLPCGRFPGNPFPVVRDGAVKRVGILDTATLFKCRRPVSFYHPRFTNPEPRDVLRQTCMGCCLLSHVTFPNVSQWSRKIKNDMGHNLFCHQRTCSPEKQTNTVFLRSYSMTYFLTVGHHHPILDSWPQRFHGTVKNKGSGKSFTEWLIRTTISQALHQHLLYYTFFCL